MSVLGYHSENEIEIRIQDSKNNITKCKCEPKYITNICNLLNKNKKISYKLYFKDIRVSPEMFNFTNQ